jgi:hypothetical protein
LNIFENFARVIGAKGTKTLIIVTAGAGLAEAGRNLAADLEAAGNGTLTTES